MSNLSWLHQFDTKSLIRSLFMKLVPFDIERFLFVDFTIVIEDLVFIFLSQFPLDF